MINLMMKLMKNNYYLWFIPELKFDLLYKVVGQVYIYYENEIYSKSTIATNKEKEFYKLIKENSTITSYHQVENIIKQLNIKYNSYNMKSIKEKVEEFLDLQNDLRIELKEYVKDKSISLDERWELFITCELGDREPYCESFESFDYDNFYATYEFSRDEEITSEDIIYRLNKDSEQYLYTTLDDVKEEILDKFLYSFKFDW